MNESLMITQVLEVNGKSYAFLIPVGTNYLETYTALSEFMYLNKLKEKEQAAQSIEDAKLQEEMNNAKAEVVMDSKEA